MNNSSLTSKSHTQNLLDNFNKLEKECKYLSDELNKFKSYFNSTPYSVFILDIDGIIEEVNLTTLNNLGYTAEELCGNHFSDFISQNNKETFLTYLTQIFSNNWEKLKTTFIDKNKNEIAVELNASVTESKNNYEIMLLINDISNLSSCKEQIENEKYLLKALMDNIPDTIYFKDLDSKFIKINKAQSKLLGVNNCDDAIGKSDFDYFSTKHAEEAFKDEKEIIKTKKALISKTEHIKTTDGKSKWLTATKVPIFDKNENIAGLVGISRDITELKAAENKIRKYAKELQYLNATKDKFFSIIAHDLKNPFFSLMGFGELLLKENGELSDDEKKNYIDNIVKISKNSYELLENLLQWSRAQTGRIEYCPNEIDLKNLLDNIIEFFAPIAQKKDIKIESKFKDSLPVYADSDMMRTVIRNLLTNSIKFTEPGGYIILDYEEDDHFYKIIVKDNGRGMNSDTLEKLFRIDVNHKSRGTSNEPGTGLGLLICKEFIEKNGGVITVKSELWKGSEFAFTVPKHN